MSDLTPAWRWLTSWTDAAPALIALTGYGQPRDKEHARQAGFDEHVAKPAEPGRILALLEHRVTLAKTWGQV